MSLNSVNKEYYIQKGALHTFKVGAGQTVYAGQPVDMAGDMTVKVAESGKSIVGIVYTGSLPQDWTNYDHQRDGYSGDKGQIVTVVVCKPLVYVTAGASIVAGNDLEVGASGIVPQPTDPLLAGTYFGKALTGGATGEKVIIALG